MNKAMMRELLIPRMMEFIGQCGRNWKGHVDRINSQRIQQKNLTI
jgi:hypothetical protein